MSVSNSALAEYPDFYLVSPLEAAKRTYHLYLGDFGTNIIQNAFRLAPFMGHSSILILSIHQL